jgi:hypothetical protein
MTRQIQSAALALVVAIFSFSPASWADQHSSEATTVCADGTPCAVEDEEPTDEDLEESCDDQVF